MNNTVIYKGIVTVTIGDNKYIIKNNGEKELGIVICKALAGYNIKNEIPAFFQIEYKVDNTWISCLKQSIPFVGISYHSAESDLGKLELNTTIQYEYKSYDKIDNSEVQFAIYNRLGKRLAYVSGDVNYDAGDAETISPKDAYNKLQKGTTMFLQWDMIFTNVDNTADSNSKN